jgi:hypothetical protein
MRIRHTDGTITISDAKDLKKAKREATTNNPRSMDGQYIEVQEDNGRRLSHRFFRLHQWGQWIDGE